MFANEDREWAYAVNPTLTQDVVAQSDTQRRENFGDLT
jgi:hypothetical protein